MTITLSRLPSSWLGRSTSFVTLLALGGCSLPDAAVVANDAGPHAREHYDPWPSDPKDTPERRNQQAIDKARQTDQVAAYLVYRILKRYAEGYRAESQAEEQSYDALRAMGLDPRTASDMLAGDYGRKLEASSTRDLIGADLELDARAMYGLLARHAPELFEAEEEAEPETPDMQAPLESAASSAGLRCLDFNDCDEVAGSVGMPLDPKWGGLKPFPRLHSAYGDLGSHGAPGWKPAVSSNQMPLHVPVMYPSFGEIPAEPVACDTDVDCVALDPQRPTCMAVDSDGNGQPLTLSNDPEFEPCLSTLDGVFFYGVDPEAMLDCLPGGFHKGDLSAQAGVPTAMLDALPPTPEGFKASTCGLAPSWTSPGVIEVPNVDEQRLFVAVRAMTDVNAGATLLRVADAEGNPDGSPTALVRMPSGDLEVILANGTRVLADNYTGAFAYVADTVTLGAQGAGQPLASFLVTAPNETTRYLPQSDHGVDDLWVVDLPDDLPSGVYELRADWHAAPYVDALFDDGTVDTTTPLNVLRTACNEAWAVTGSPSLDAMCSMYDAATYTGFLEGDPTLLSNPIYVRIVDGEQVERFTFEVPNFQIEKTQETYDDPTFQTVMWAFDGSDPDTATLCKDQMDAIVAGEETFELTEEVAPQDCVAKWFTKGPFDDIDEEGTHALDFEATFDLTPDHEVWILTEMWEDDDYGDTTTALKESKSVLLAAKAIVDALDEEGDGDDPDVPQIIGAVADLLGGLTELLEDLKKPEFLGSTLTRYTYDDVVYLTHAAQMGLSSQDITDAHTSGDRPLPSLNEHTFDATLEELEQGTVVVTDKPYLDGMGSFTVNGDTVWGAHHQIRRVRAQNEEGTQGSDDSCYDLHYAITHQRD